jgi:tetratricopeptide (TPR) repeat protein
MADGELVERWRVFLASPGDVGEERASVRDFLQNVLPHKPLLHRRMTFELVSWDDPHHGTTLTADMTPQEAVTRFHGEPASCQIVIVILWSHMGTHLDVSRDRKPDGSPFLSGTEWEYLNALGASPRREILVYRREDPAPADLDDPKLDEKREQRRLVGQFFAQFTNADGSARGGYRPYRGVDEFRRHFAADLERLVAEHLAHLDASAVAGSTSSGETEPILPPVRCFGRDAEADSLVAALTAAKPACLLVLGSAGIGKTTLTRRVATDPAVAARFGQRRYFVPLETATDDAALRVAIIQAIGLNPASANFNAALARLAEQPALLVLDNLETPWEPEPGAVQDTLLALSATPNVSLLVSLRGSVAPPSPRWTERPTRVEALPEAQARRLFLELAPEAERDATHLGSFLTALGGVPLAVELVAMRAAGDTPLAELWSEWQRLGIELAEHPDQDPGRRTSLRRSLDLSWGSRRLREPGRRLFRLLGALPSGMADADRQTLMSTDATEAARQVGAVSLAFSRDGRLDLLPPVRDYARALHPPEGDEAVLWCRHYLTLARDVGGRIFKAEGASAVIRLTPELPNIQSALQRAVEGEMWTEAAAALDGAYRVMSVTGAGSLATLEALAGACHAANDLHAEARSRYFLGVVALDRSEYDMAFEAYKQALPLYRQLGDVLGETKCIVGLGDIALDRSDYSSAHESYEQALALNCKAGDVRGEALCVARIGDIAFLRSEYNAAREAYIRALSLFRQIEDVLGQANCIHGLGEIERDRSEYDLAYEAYQRALTLYRQVGDARGEANCLRGYGDVALRQLDHGAASDAYFESLRLFRQIGDLLGEASCVLGMGDVALARGDHNVARDQFFVALGLYQRARQATRIAVVHERLARMSNDAERDRHVLAARSAWTSMDLPDMVARLDQEFG